MTDPSPRDRLRRWAAPGGPRWPLALVAYVAAAVVATWPLAGRLTTHTFGGPGDGWALIWQTWERARSGPAYFQIDRYGELAWPFGTDTSTAAFLSNALIELPNIALLKLGLGDVLAYNLLTLAALVGSSLAMYLLVRRLDGSAVVAGWAGLAYMWVPWHLEKAAIHLQLSALVWLPLALLAIVEFARRPGLRTAMWLVGACAIGLYTHVYYGLMAGLLLVVAAPVVLGFAIGRHKLALTARWMAAVAGGVALAALPLAVALRLQAEEIGLLIDRPLSLGVLAGDTHRYLLPAVGNPLFGDRAGDYLARNDLPLTEGELALYLGWVTIALAVVAVVAAVRGGLARLPLVLGLVVVATGLVFALPATVELPLLGTLNTPVHFLVEAVDFLSTPSRFVAMTITGLILVAALGLEWLRGRVPGGRWAGVGVVLGIAAVSALELIAFTDGRVVDARPSPATRLIQAHVPAGEPVAQFPSTERSLLPVANQLYAQTQHGHPLFNGASVGTPEDVVRRELERIERPQTPRVLRLLGVRYATVEPGVYPFAPFQDYPEQAFTQDDPARWRTVAQDGFGGRLIELTAAPATGFGARADDFYFEYQDLHWMKGLSAALLVCSDRAGRRELVFDANAFGGERRLRVGDAPEVTIVSAPEPTPLRVEVGLRAGWQWVPLRVIGSQPVRPIDLAPESGDGRELAVAVGLVDVEGGDGAPVSAPCSGPIPPAPSS